MAPGGLDPREEEVHGRALERLAGGRHRQWPHPDHALGGLAGRGDRGDREAAVGRRVQDALEGRPEHVGMDVDAVDDQEGVSAVEGAAHRALVAVAGRRPGLERVDAGGEHVVGRADAASVHPRSVRVARRGMAGEQGLPAARWTDDADPPRGREGGVQCLLDTLAT
jgi:hypothetical protein